MSFSLFANNNNNKNNNNNNNNNKGAKRAGFGFVDGDHVSGLGSPLMSEALLTAHDGIAGAWHDVAGTPAQLLSETDANLARWSADVRAEIFAFDLLEPYSFVTAGEEAKLQVREAGVDRDLVVIRRPDPEVFRLQVPYLAGYADLRPDRLSEILAQTTDIASFAGAIGMLHPERTAKTLELLAVLSAAASTVVLRFKHALASRRPAEYSPQVQPIIQTPAHSAFPSGHATQAFLQAYVLSELLRPCEAAVFGKKDTVGIALPLERVWWTMLRRQAIRITVNRVVAGVHFPVDGAAGAVLGLALGRDFVARMAGEGQKRDRVSLDFNGPFPGDSDVGWRALINRVCDEVAAGDDAVDYLDVRQIKGQAAPAPARTLRWLWQRALEEWPAGQ